MNSEDSRRGVAMMRAKSADEFFASGGSDGVGSALGPAAVSADVFRGDEFGAHEPTDCVIEGAPLEHEDLVFVAVAQQASASGRDALEIRARARAR